MAVVMASDSNKRPEPSGRAVFVVRVPLGRKAMTAVVRKQCLAAYGYEVRLIA